MIRAIFLDVDGTLVSFDTHRVPQSAIDLHEIEEVPFDAVIALNGSDCVLRDGTSVSKKQISDKDFQKAYALSRQFGFPIAVETDNGIFVNELNPIVIELARLVDHPVPPVIDIEKEFVEGKCCQLCFYCDEETEKEVMAQLPNLSASRWHPIFADINVKGVDKASGIREFASYYDFDISHTIAFGDGGNDISMLREAGIGIAMGGAAESIRAVSDYVTDTVDNDGIRNALIHFGII